MSGKKRMRAAWATLVTGVTLTAAIGLLSTGCSIRTQAPIKEIAYDFSDRDFYDRAYAASPQYAEMEPVYVDQAPHRERSDLGLASDGQPTTLLGEMPAVMPTPSAVARSRGTAK
jgi:hypothetical protein